MKIAFGVVVCILSCGIEGTLIDEQFCSSPMEIDIPTVRSFKIYEARRPYYGSGQLKIEKPGCPIYTLEVQPNSIVPYVMEIVYGATKPMPRYELKEIIFDKGDMTKGQAIGVEVVFEKDKCRFTVHAFINPEDQYFQLDEACEDFLHWVNVESCTYDLKWIQNILNGERDIIVSSRLYGGYWMQDYQAPDFHVTMSMIQSLLDKTSLQAA